MASPTSGVLAVMSMLFLVKLSLIEFDLSLASSETRRSEFRNVSRSSVTRSFVSVGNDLAIVRIIAFDQFRNEQRAVEIERDLAAAEADLHIAFIGQQALQFRDRFRRHDDVGFVAARKFELDIDHGEAPSIGRDERELVVLQAEENAVQDVARFIGGDGVGGFAQTIAQILLPNGDDLGAFEFRERRKFFLGQTEDLEETLAAANGGRVLAIDLELNFARRQFANDGEEPTRRQGGGAFLVHFRFETAAHAHIQIGGGEMDFVAFRLQKHVRQNRQRGAGADDVLHLLQSFEQFLFRDAEFHGRAS